MKRKDIIVSAVFALLLVVLFLIPTGFQKAIYYNSENCRAIVLDADNSTVYNIRHFKQGEQTVNCLIKSGSFKGEEVRAINLLSGKMETDKLYKTGDSVMLLVEKNDNDEIIVANTVDYYRIDKEIILVLIFVISIILLSGTTGVKTVMSFTFTLAMIIKVLVPLMLKGYDPLIVSLVVGVIIATFTVLIISGFNERSYSAILTTVFSGFFTLIMSLIFSRWMNLDGTTMAWSESLIFAGFESLNLMKIFQGAVYLSCLGAVIDLSVDISSALWEIKQNNGDTTKIELINSGLNIGKTVVGSQATTLLLAYMGSYLTVIMVYMAQGTPILNILTSKAIASEILNTFVGVIALITVPPIASILSANMLCAEERKGKENLPNVADSKDSVIVKS